MSLLKNKNTHTEKRKQKLWSRNASLTQSAVETVVFSGVHLLLFVCATAVIYPCYVCLWYYEKQYARCSRSLVQPWNVNLKHCNQKGKMCKKEKKKTPAKKSFSKPNLSNLNNKDFSGSSKWKSYPSFALLIIAFFPLSRWQSNCSLLFLCYKERKDSNMKYRSRLHYHFNWNTDVTGSIDLSESTQCTNQGDGKKCGLKNASACEDKERNAYLGLVESVRLAAIAHWRQPVVMLFPPSFVVLLAFKWTGCHCWCTQKGFQGNGQCFAWISAEWNIYISKQMRSRND